MLKDTDIRILKVASLLASQPNIKQKEVAEQLRMEPAQVAKDKAVAIENGWYREQRTVELPTADLTADQRQEIEAVFFPELRETARCLRAVAAQSNFRVRPRIHLVPVKEDADYELFGRVSADTLKWLFGAPGIRTVGVAWGRTLWSTMNGLRHHRLDSLEHVLFLPISGDPLNSQDRGNSPSDLAGILSELYGSENRLSLHGVPARMPKRMQDDERTIREFINYCEAYRKIFGYDGHSGRMGAADMVVCGIGDAATSKEDPWYLDVKIMEDGESLSRIAVGNIGGVWLPKTEIDGSEKQRVKEINSRWLGISDKQLENCAVTAAAQGTPGVVVIAREREKIEIFMRTLGMVNHYVVSRELLEAAQEKLQE